ncbi:MAG: DUF1385 domain-containing protein [Candidatus Bathyarchaeia archaeon]
MKSNMKRRHEPSLAFGGQAVIEGVMIRSRNYMVISVRQPNKQILTKTEKINSLTEKHNALKLPFLRGIVALFETLYLGINGLSFSANVSLGEKEQLKTKEIVLSVIFALVLAVSLFSITPFLLSNLLGVVGLAFYWVEAGIRLAIFMVYLGLMGLLKDMRRVFQYHGAEHMAINTYEAGMELNVENAKKFSRLHPRCGTSFLLIVTVISILVFSIMPNLGFWITLSYRILLIPLISAISYEILKLSDRYKNSPIMKILTLPGLGLQYLTTRKPDDDMLEVALNAVKEVDKLTKPTA